MISKDKFSLSRETFQGKIAQIIAFLDHKRQFRNYRLVSCGIDKHPYLFVSNYV